MELKQRLLNMEPTYQVLTDLMAIIVDQQETVTDMETCRYVRKHAMKLRTPDAYELVHKTYLYGARNNFDDFWIALEWNRPADQRFWLPRRSILEGKFHIASTIQWALDHPEEKPLITITMPPGMGKSTLIKGLYAYQIGRNPQSKNMYSSNTDDMTVMAYSAVKEMLSKDSVYDFYSIFPELLKEPDSNAKSHSLSYGTPGDAPTLACVSIGGTPTGRTRVQDGGIFVGDDIVKGMESAMSMDQMDKLFKHFCIDFMSRRLGDKYVTFIVGTKWSSFDPMAKIVEIYGDDNATKVISIPVEDEDGHSNFDYSNGKGYSDKDIADLKRLYTMNQDYESFLLLYMGMQVDRLNSPFSEDQLQYFTELPDGEPDAIRFACDVAWGGGDSLSMPIEYVYGDDVYIVDWIHNTGDKKITKPLVMGSIIQHKARLGQFEANNGGHEYADDISRMLREDYNYKCGISAKKSPTNIGKLERIKQYVPEIKQMHFLHRSKRDKEYNRAMSELHQFSFSAKNKHDDAPDALAMLAEFNTSGLKEIRVFRRTF